ncbi:MAG TPA: hypothetical protein VJU84_10705 [Pyrinomonadaceae bacterium]|nr:hypothetical protein [Pyrinomonadaceae bacterium]
MTNKPEIPSLVQELETVSIESSEAVQKKAFVEPELSSPVDVLEATTFFQFTESGVTN